MIRGFFRRLLNRDCLFWKKHGRHDWRYATAYSAQTSYCAGYACYDSWVVCRICGKRPIGSVEGGVSIVASDDIERSIRMLKEKYPEFYSQVEKNYK